MAGQPTATLTEGATLSHVLGLKDGSTIRQSLGDLAAQLLVSPELAALIGNYDLFQGEWDASGGVFPSGAAKGHFWRVSQAGAATVDGVSFAASDVLIALVDDASTEVYAGNWHKAAYAGVSHEHAISAIVGLQAALDAKASAEQGEKADTAVQPGDLAGVATSGSSDDLSEGVAKLLMTAAERSKLAGIEAGVFPVSDRPGDHPEAFSAGYTGAGAAKEPLSGGTEVVGAGTAYVLTGAGTVAARYPVALNNDVVEFTARFRRTANPSDPNNHAVRLQVAWLDKSKSLIGSVQTLASKSDALTSSGLIELSTRVSSMAVEDVVTPPMGAVYACPFIQTYGEDGATAIETLRILEVTDLHTIESADLSTLIAQTEAARDAAETAANVVATETLDTMADVASYDRAAGVGVISLKGGYARGDGLGGQWVYDPDGVEVTPDAPTLLIGNDGANYKMAAANLVYRTKPNIAALAAATDIAVGQTITVPRSHNSEKETFIAVAPGTYTANGTTVVDGVSVQLVSTRMRFKTDAEFQADTRPDAWFTAGDYIGVGGGTGYMLKKVASNEDRTTDGGATWEVLTSVIGFNVRAFQAKGDGVTDDTDAVEAAIYAAFKSGRVSGTRRFGCCVALPAGKYRIAQSARLFKSFPRQDAGAASFSFFGAGANAGYSSAEGASVLMFDPPTNSDSEVMVDNDSRIYFTRFFNIGFVSNNGGTFWSGQEGSGVQSFEFRDCGFRDFANFFDIGGIANNSEWSFYACKFAGFTGKAFHFNNEQALNWRFYGCDAEVFSGTLFHYSQGTNVSWWGGSIIPTSSTCRIFHVINGATGVGANNAPHLKFDGVRFELRAGLFSEKLVANSAFILSCTDCDMGGYQIPSGNVLKWVGAGQVNFTRCGNLGGYLWDHTVDGSSASQRLRVNLRDCSSVGGAFVKDSIFAITGATANTYNKPLFDVQNTHPELDGRYIVGSTSARDTAAVSRGIGFTPESGRIHLAAMPGGGWPKVETLALPPVRVLKIEVYPTSTASFGSNSATVTVKNVSGTTLATFTWTMNAPPVYLSADINQKLTEADDELTFEFSSSYTGGTAVTFNGAMYLTY